MSDFEKTDIPFIFVIRTNSYTGNFEREITGYSTGVDDGTHGDEEAAVFYNEVDREIGESLASKVYFASGDSSYERCCSIWSYQGFEYNDVAIFFHEIPTAEELNLISSRAKKYGAEHNIEIVGFAIISRTVKVEDDSSDWEPTEA